MTRSIYIYIFIMIFVSFLIRVLPMTIFTRQIKNKFLRSFLYYVPYVTLSVMAFPAMITDAGNRLGGAVAFTVSIISSFFGANLFIVSILSALAMFIVEMLGVTI